MRRNDVAAQPGKRRVRPTPRVVGEREREDQAEPVGDVDVEHERIAALGASRERDERRERRKLRADEHGGAETELEVDLALDVVAAVGPGCQRLIDVPQRRLGVQAKARAASMLPKVGVDCPDARAVRLAQDEDVERLQRRPTARDTSQRRARSARVRARVEAMRAPHEVLVRAPVDRNGRVLLRAPGRRREAP